MGKLAQNLIQLNSKRLYLKIWRIEDQSLSFQRFFETREFFWTLYFHFIYIPFKTRLALVWFRFSLQFLVDQSLLPPKTLCILGTGNIAMFIICMDFITTWLPTKEWNSGLMAPKDLLYSQDRFLLDLKDLVNIVVCFFGSLDNLVNAVEKIDLKHVGW